MPFRKWYGCLGEVRSLIPTATRLVILTATATKATKGEILNTLHLSGEDVKFIEQSPDRPNIKYCAQYLDKNEPTEASFSTLIEFEELKTMRGNTPTTLIYCQTRKQCSVLFRMFEVFLPLQNFDRGFGENLGEISARSQNLGGQKLAEILAEILVEILTEILARSQNL